MSEKVVPLGNITRLNIPPDRVLKAAIGEFDDDGVVIMGWDKNGELYFASSIASGATVVWLLEACKRRLMEPGDD